MTKQMHQVDDQSDPRKSGFWQRNPAASEPSAFSLRDETPQNTNQNQGPSGQETHGMGRRNPFENWQITNANDEQETLLPPNNAKVKSAFGLIWQVISTVLLAGIITATLLSMWMPGSLIPGNLGQKVAEVVAEDGGIVSTEVIAGALPANFPINKIGIIVGHRGHDSGAVCANGLTELEINSNVATYVQQKLIKAGFEVELLDEFDSRINNYQAGLLLSLHSDSCDYINDSATGFKVTAALSSNHAQGSTRLVECLADRYANITGLRYHYQSVTTEMTSYHAFSEINPNTTAGIIELGFMNLDQEILTTQPELLAEGVAQGVSCYMNNEEVSQP
ncbi:MAG: N-acetylmuramoyl-L-alanine amidase [Anaerolineaceae bacterium]|nr:N-acetylmuramoyl-L-alanine amidase [Anaerolineaceae bacterium]MDD4043676.1 N-acetylmuramoyl-L-alanine amidase [Anaerolineaceae bacterium]